MRRVAHLVRKEFLELRQDPRLFGIVILAPILQLTMLGYAATTDVLDVPVIVVDRDGSSASRQLITRFETSPNFVLVDAVTSIDAIGPYLDGGDAWLALTIPADYGERIGTRRPVAIQFVADGTDANSTNVALGYARALVAEYARALAASGGGRIASPLIGADVRVWFNPSLESRDFMIPGILALVLLVVTTNLSSMAIVREKELGTLEQLNVTPLARWELIAGKLLPYAVLGMVDALLVVAVAVGWFEVPLRGSFALLMVMCLVYLLTTLGLGLFVSTISRTQQQAMMTTSFFFSAADGLPVRVHLSDREHAGRHPAGDVPDSAPLFSGHPARNLPEGHRSRRVVAGGARAPRVGHRHPDAGHAEIDEAARVTRRRASNEVSVAARSVLP